MEYDPHEWFTIQERKPEPSQVIIVERKDGQRDQVNVRNGNVYEWRYHDTHNVFCKEDEIKAWRGCTGFDF